MSQKFNLQNFVKFQKFQLHNLVDLKKCCKTRIYFQGSVPIQPKMRAHLQKFDKNTLRARRPRRLLPGLLLSYNGQHL